MFLISTASVICFARRLTRVIVFLNCFMRTDISWKTHQISTFFKREIRSGFFRGKVRGGIDSENGLKLDHEQMQSPKPLVSESIVQSFDGTEIDSTCDLSKQQSIILTRTLEPNRTKTIVSSMISSCFDAQKRVCQKAFVTFFVIQWGEGCRKLCGCHPLVH